MALTIKHKRGDTFYYQVATRYDGKPSPLYGMQVNSYIRTSDDDLLTRLKVTILDVDNGIFEILATAEQTKLWEPDAAKLDIEYTDAGGVVKSTETVTVDIIEDVTYETAITVPRKRRGAR